MGLWVRVRGLALAGLVLGGVVVGLGVASLVAADFAVAQTATSIVVEGNRRVESDTIRSYFRVGPGERLDSVKADEGVKALFATGLFADVRPRWEGGRLIVTVVENAVINRIQFEGNKRVKDEQLIAEIQSKPRGTLSRPTVQADVQRIVEIYRRTGRYDVRVEPKIIDRPNNRVDLVFEINEGGKTTVKDIDFVGNRAYSAWRLKDVIKTGSSNILSFLKNNDLYDPDRIESDRDLLRRFYLKNGYADVRIVSAVAEYDPAPQGLHPHLHDRGRRPLHASARSTFSPSVRDVDPAVLRSKLRFSAGVDLQRRGGREDRRGDDDRGRRSAATPSRRCARAATATSRPIRSTSCSSIEEGARAYIERINIRGNTRTRDYVIRREFDIAEGDAYNRVLVDRAERRLKNLNYFKTRQDHQRAGLGARPRRSSTSTSKSNRPASSRSRAAIRPPTASSPKSAVGERNLLGRGQYGARLGHLRPACARRRTVVRRTVSSSTIGWPSASTCSPSRPTPSSSYIYRQETIGGGFRFGIPLREDLCAAAALLGLSAVDRPRSDPAQL